MRSETELYPGLVVLAPVLPIAALVSDTTLRRKRKVTEAVVKDDKYGAPCDLGQPQPISLYSPAEVTQICSSRGGTAMVRFLDSTLHNGTVAVPVTFVLRLNQREVPRLRCLAAKIDSLRFESFSASNRDNLVAQDAFGAPFLHQSGLKNENTQPPKRERSSPTMSPKAASALAMAGLGSTTMGNACGAVRTVYVDGPSTRGAVSTATGCMFQLVNTVVEVITALHAWRHLLVFRDASTLLQFRDMLHVVRLFSSTAAMRGMGIFVAVDDDDDGEGGDSCDRGGGSSYQRQGKCDDIRASWFLCVLDDVVWKCSDQMITCGRKMSFEVFLGSDSRLTKKERTTVFLGPTEGTPEHEMVSSISVVDSPPSWNATEDRLHSDPIGAVRDSSVSAMQEHILSETLSSIASKFISTPQLCLFLGGATGLGFPTMASASSSHLLKQSWSGASSEAAHRLPRPSAVAPFAALLARESGQVQELSLPSHRHALLAAGIMVRSALEGADTCRITSWDALRAVWQLLVLFDTFAFTVHDDLFPMQRQRWASSEALRIFDAAVFRIGDALQSSVARDRPLVRYLNSIYRKQMIGADAKGVSPKVLVLINLDLSLIEHSLASHAASSPLRTVTLPPRAALLEDVFLDHFALLLDHRAHALHAPPVVASEGLSCFARCASWLSSSRRRCDSWRQSGGTMIASIAQQHDRELMVTLDKGGNDAEAHVAMHVVLMECIRMADVVVLVQRGAVRWFNDNVPNLSSLKSTVVRCVTTSTGLHAPLSERDLTPTLQSMWKRISWSCASNNSHRCRDDVALSPSDVPHDAKELFSRIFPSKVSVDSFNDVERNFTEVSLESLLSEQSSIEFDDTTTK